MPRTITNVPSNYFLPTPTAGLRPLGDTLIVQARETNGISAGGVVLPETAHSLYSEALVVAVGPGKTENGILVPTTVKVGNVVLMMGSRPDYRRGGETYKIIRESDVLAVIE